MPSDLREFFRFIAAALAVVAIGAGPFGAGPVAAQAWPARPIRYVVPFPPGGGADLIARAMSPRLAEKFGQPVLVENRPGAGGMIAVEFVAKSPPDGYVIGLGNNGTLALGVALGQKMPIDPVKDLAPISMLATSPFFLIAHPATQAATVRDVIADARSDPGKLSLAHGGNGTSMHLSGKLLEIMTGTQLLGVPYKGDSAAVTDVIGGQVQYAIVSVPSALAQIRAGRLKALGVTASKRIGAAPQVPTIAESGVPGYETMAFFGLVTAAGTPGEVIRRLNAEIVAALQAPEVRDRLTQAGAEPHPSTPEEFAALIRNQIAMWSRVVRTSGVSID